MQGAKNVTYIKKASGKDITKAVKSVLFPVAVFFLCLVSITIFKNFGRLLMAPLLGVMWIIGAGCAFWMPAQRKSIIGETLTTIAVYNGTLLGLRQLIAITGGISSQMLMATFSQPLAAASANTIPGFLQNALYISAAMIPLTFAGMQFKRILQFRRSANKQKVLEQLRNIRQAKSITHD